MPFRLDIVETSEQWVVTCTTPHGKAVPGWLATTARRESCRALREPRGSQTVGYVLDIEIIPSQQGGIAGDELLHRQAERQS
jgi:hypothetical protein